MIEISKALKIIKRETAQLGAEKIGISDCVGRVLAEPIIADTDLPPFDRSQMDGYAAIASDIANAPVTLKLVGESAAGRGWRKTLKSGETIAIMTGAPVPDGADAVQKIELTRISDQTGQWSGGAGSAVEILEPVRAGQFIVRRGSEIKKGTTIFKAGEYITENMIAPIAAFGYAKLRVSKHPRVAILGTGSEIVEINKKPGRDQIRNSNSVMLDIMARRFAGITSILSIARDDIADLISQIAAAAKNADILIITGGVSVGKYDHTKTALEELGATIFFEKLRLKPGKPAVFARLGKTLIFGLPGNPVSAAVTFHLFVRKAMLCLQGAAETELKNGFAILAADAKGAAERDTYLPARCETNELGQLLAHPLKWQGSSDFIGFSRADIFIFVPRGTQIKKGEAARIFFI